MYNPVWSYFFPSAQKKEITIELLKNLPMFEALSMRELVQIERILHERIYKAGERVFNEGEPGAGMYIVKKGEIAITRKHGDTSIQLALIQERSFFGEVALLDEIPRSASAVATVETVLFGFSKPDLENILERNLRLGCKILENLSRIMCRRLLKANENVEFYQTELDKLKGGANQ